MRDIKGEIVTKLLEIELMAKKTGAKGMLKIEVFDCTMFQFQEALSRIDEFPRFEHTVTVCDGLNVQILY